ncbi:MAG TPA: DUF1269 domain-containing protein [Janthinobacterium sp.]|nr:DUF1269 domain-containing protein [Janthinobacterium sp.]
MLPGIASGRAMLDELLLARIEERHMHFLAREGTLPPDMPDLNALQKTDLVHGAQLGMLIGGAVGLGAGIFMVLFPPDGLTLRTVAILIAALGGAIFGAWASGMNAAAVPNSRLAKFAERVEEGQVLLIVDVAPRKVREIEEMMASRHPEISFAGAEPPMVAFP